FCALRGPHAERRDRNRYFRAIMGCPGRYGIEWRQSPRAAEHRAAALFLRINETHLPSNPAAQISVPAFKNDATRDCFYRKSRTLVQSFRAPRFRSEEHTSELQSLA